MTHIYYSIIVLHKQQLTTLYTYMYTGFYYKNVNRTFEMILRNTHLYTRV